MGVGWLGFAKGASKAGLDAIVAREEEDSRKKLAELQEKLRRETSEIEFKRNVKRDEEVFKRDLAKPKDNVFDPVTGKFRILDSMGRQVGERDATQAEKDKYNLDMEGEKLGLEVKRANINQSNASAEASRASAGYSRAAAANVGKKGASGSLDGSSVVGDDPYTTGQELLGMRPGLVKSLEAMKVDPSLIEEAAATAARAAVTNRGLKSEQERIAYALRQLDQRLQQLKNPTALTRNSGVKYTLE